MTTRTACSSAPTPLRCRRGADALRGLLVDERTPAFRNATVRMASDMMDTMIDLIAAQHRCIEQLKGPSE